jgi:hypothetical protein
MGSALAERVGPPDKSAFTRCMWRKGKSILDVVTTRCSQNGTRYEDAVGEAFDEAIIGCQRR